MRVDVEKKDGSGLGILALIALPLVCCGVPLLIAAGTLAAVGGWLSANGVWLAAAAVLSVAVVLGGGWWVNRQPCVSDMGRE